MKPIKVMKANDPRDPVTRVVEKGDHEEGMSPYDPPDPYSPPGEGQAIPYEMMHPTLQAFRDEHKACEAELKAFEETLDAIVENGPGAETDEGLRRFFTYIEREILPHNQREELKLFPLLEKRLLAAGEHSQGAVKKTAVTVMISDHREFLQMSAVMTNFFRLAPRLPDDASRKYVLDAAIRQGRSILEHMRLHIFREDDVVFSLAHKLIGDDDLAEMAH